MKQAPLIDVRDLTKSFNQVPVVKGLTLKVEQGQIFGFLGANGSGKTTSIRMICGLLTPDGGSGQCMGYDVVAQSYEIKKKVGYMPQKFSLYKELSVVENLEFVAKIYGVTDIRQKIKEAMELVQIENRAHQLASELSGGWKQRLSFAACLVHQPKLLLLDEPTAGIDPLARRDFWDLIHHLSQKGVTTLMSTHYMDEAERCHALAYLSNGKVLVKGSVDEVIASTEILTYQLIGDLPAALLMKLKNLDEVNQAAWFGRSFHVCTNDKQALAVALNQLSQEFSFEYHLIPSSLEDAFIALGGRL